MFKCDQICPWNYYDKGCKKPSQEVCPLSNVVSQTKPQHANMVDNKNCRNCVYFGGASDHVCTCNYIFMEDKMRPCPPGKGCTVKVKRKKRRLLADDKWALYKEKMKG